MGNPSYHPNKSGNDPTLDAFMRKHPGASNVADYEHGAKYYPWSGEHAQDRETLHPHDDAVDGFDDPQGSTHYPYADPQDHGSYIDHYRPHEDQINQFNRLSLFVRADNGMQAGGLTLPGVGDGGGGMKEMGPDGQKNMQGSPGSGGGVPDTNVPQGPGTPGSGGGSSNPLDPNLLKASRSPFFDPHDASVRVLAAMEDEGGSSPSPPPQMTGGPGAAAMPPMPEGASSSSNVPQSTPPRQTPSGGGGAGMPGGGDPEAGMGPAENNPGASPGTPKAGRRSTGAELNRAVENPDDPTGLGDEYLNKSLPNALTQRPRQPEDHRNVNTPQKPADTIPTTSSPGTPGGDEDDRREASLIAARAARAVLERA